MVLVVRSTSFHGIGGEVDFISWYLGLHFMVWCMLHLFNYKPVMRSQHLLRTATLNRMRSHHLLRTATLSRMRS